MLQIILTIQRMSMKREFGSYLISLK